MTLPDDRTAAALMVDRALDYVGASASYRALHRERMIQQHLPWCVVERGQREARTASQEKRHAA